MEGLDVFNIQLIPHAQNRTADALAQAARTLQPLSLFEFKKFMVELTSTPFVLDNVTHLQVFNDDKHILQFITSRDVFIAQIIDETDPQEAELDIEGVINLKTNTIPRGMVQLEHIFDLD